MEYGGAVKSSLMALSIALITAGTGILQSVVALSDASTQKIVTVIVAGMTILGVGVGLVFLREYLKKNDLNANKKSKKKSKDYYDEDEDNFIVRNKK